MKLSFCTSTLQFTKNNRKQPSQQRQERHQRTARFFDYDEKRMTLEAKVVVEVEKEKEEPLVLDENNNNNNNNNNNKIKKKKKDILLVLDLNGVLFDRRRQTRNSNKRSSDSKDSGSSISRDACKPDAILGNFHVYNRPHLHEFIDFLLDNFTCAVWSSVQKHNLEMLVDHAWGKERRKKLLFVWGQDKCTSVGFFGDGSPAYHNKPVFLKETRRRIFWTHHKILLVDDSPYKALKNPQFTSIHPREWIAFGGGDENKGGYKDDELSENGKLRRYLEKIVEANESNVSLPRFIRQTPYYVCSDDDDDRNKEDEEKAAEKMAHVMRLLKLSSFDGDIHTTTTTKTTTVKKEKKAPSTSKIPVPRRVALASPPSSSPLTNGGNAHVSPRLRDRK